MYLIYAALTVLGFLPFAIILYKINRFNRMKKNGVSTTGIVLDVPFGSFKTFKQSDNKLYSQRNRHRNYKRNCSSRVALPDRR